MTENPETSVTPEPEAVSTEPAAEPAPAEAPPAAERAPAEAPPAAERAPAEAPPAAERAPAEAPPAPEPAVSEPAPVEKRPRDRRRIAVATAIGVLVAAVLAGVACTAVTVQGADRDPGAPVWSLPKAAKETKPAGGSGLQGMLLPYDGDTYGRGPDLGQFGSDAAFSGKQANLLRKESIKDLPRSQRQQLERQLDRNPVKGMAMRSYVNTAGTPGYEYTMEIVLAQMGNQRTVRSLAAVQKELFDALKVLRKGPEIEGYKDSASCFLPPADSAEKLDTMFCTGYVGDVLVTATATAGKPLDKESAADMLRAQLDRIKEPGASV
ncbi:hypothetical protein ACWDGI_23975 [Streptomyces sp. NPDC001220]